MSSLVVWGLHVCVHSTVILTSSQAPNCCATPRAAGTDPLNSHPAFTLFNGRGGKEGEMERWRQWQRDEKRWVKRELVDGCDVRETVIGVTYVGESEREREREDREEKTHKRKICLHLTKVKHLTHFAIAIFIFIWHFKSTIYHLSMHKGGEKPLSPGGSTNMSKVITHSARVIPWNKRMQLKIFDRLALLLKGKWKGNTLINPSKVVICRWDSHC